jgi:Type II secretion system (T2SS), protein E, N-terminal domain
LPKPLAEIVLEEGLANAASLERAAAAADRDGSPLVCALVRECEIDEVALLAALRRHVRVATEDPATVAPEPEAVRELQRDVCRRQRVAPLSLSSYGGEGRVLRLAMADPTDAVAIAEVEHVTGCRVEPVLMTVSAVEELVEKTYRALVTEVMRRVDEGAPAPEPTAPHTARAKSPTESGEAGEAIEEADGPSSARPDETVTVPFHKLSDEAPVETRLRALINVLLARNLVSSDELEDEVRRLMQRRPGKDRG